MKKLNSKQIKKAMFGLILTDGSITGKRFSIYSKEESLANDVINILENISGIEKIHKKQIKDIRFFPPALGWRVWTTSHPYLEKINNVFYDNKRKKVNKYISNRLDEISFAYAWMCDGYLEHQKNRKENKVQNKGWLCLESFPKEELKLIVERLRYFRIESRTSPVKWGFGYRIQMSGTNLQKFIDMIYPHVLDCYKYKTIMYYKSENSKYVLTNLSNAKHIIKSYINVDDIVRHS